MNIYHFPSYTRIYYISQPDQVHNTPHHTTIPHYADIHRPSNSHYKYYTHILYMVNIPFDYNIFLLHEYIRYSYQTYLFRIYYTTHMYHKSHPHIPSLQHVHNNVCLHHIYYNTLSLPDYTHYSYK